MKYTILELTFTLGKVCVRAINTLYSIDFSRNMHLNKNICWKKGQKKGYLYLLMHRVIQGNAPIKIISQRHITSITARIQEKKWLNFSAWKRKQSSEVRLLNQKYILDNNHICSGFSCSLQLPWHS